MSPTLSSLTPVHRLMLAQVRSDSPDLSQRQLAVLMTVAMTAGPHTVRGLAAALNVAKPVITRALDRMGELDLARREPDLRDRRSVLVALTTKGRRALREMAAEMGEA